MLLAPAPQADQRQRRPKAESPTCGNCCVALANGRCCDVSPCFGRAAPPPPLRNSVHERQRRHDNQYKQHPQQQQQLTKSTQNSAVTRLPFRKNCLQSVCRSSNNYLCVSHFLHTLNGELGPQTPHGNVPIIFTYIPIAIAILWASCCLQLLLFNAPMSSSLLGSVFHEWAPTYSLAAAPQQLNNYVRRGRGLWPMIFACPNETVSYYFYRPGLTAGECH